MLRNLRMNKFSKVFEAVKTYHRDTDSINLECYSFISGYANVPINKLETYFRTLQKLDLINYNWERNTVSLTPFGQKQEQLFTTV